MLIRYAYYTATDRYTAILRPNIYRHNVAYQTLFLSGRQ